MAFFNMRTDDTVQETRVAHPVEAILTQIARVRELTAKAKEQAAKLEEELLLHEGYFTAAQAVDEARKGKKDVRVAIMTDNPDLYDLSGTVKKLRSDLSLERGTLSDLLLEYQKKSGESAIETADGVRVTIRHTASVQMALF